MNPQATTPKDFAHLDMPQRLLLGPGPSMVDPRVYKAMMTPLVGHLDPKFIQLMDRTQALLRYVMQTDNLLTIPVSGTGSAAMEAAIANMVEPGDPVLVCINGYFGLRLAEMARRYGGAVETITRPWGETFSLDEIGAALEQRPAKVVAIVHAETSSGALQPLEGLADMVHAQDGVLIVDAVTSLGGVPLKVDEWDIDVCYSGSQKCLSAPPGISPITFSPRAQAKLEGRKTTVANWYLDMTLLPGYWGESRAYHHTAPITSIYALYESLRLIAEEGLEARWQRHADIAALFWQGLEAMGMGMHVPEALRTPTLTTVRIPDGVDEAAVRRALLNEYNIEIAGGLGELKGKVWRVGLMGYSAQRENVLLLLAALDKLLN
jgi:alanine-glyoxylate transaminase/serine-glyoxylate transaminase/serine-pyruvate transaminase